MLKNFFLWVIIAIVLVSVFNNFQPKQGSADEQLSYSDFIQKVKVGEINSATIQDQTISGKLQSGKTFTTYMPTLDDHLLPTLLDKGVNVKGEPPAQESLLTHIFISWFPMILLIAVWVFFMRQMQGGGRGGAFSFGRSRARMLGEDQVKITFLDVAGV